MPATSRAVAKTNEDHSAHGCSTGYLVQSSSSSRRANRWRGFFSPDFGGRSSRSGGGWRWYGPRLCRDWYFDRGRKAGRAGSVRTVAGSRTISSATFVLGSPLGTLGASTVGAGLVAGDPDDDVVGKPEPTAPVARLDGAGIAVGCNSASMSRRREGAFFLYFLALFFDADRLRRRVRSCRNSTLTDAWCGRECRNTGAFAALCRLLRPCRARAARGQGIPQPHTHTLWLT
jgi:hypothetical protein